MTGRIKVYVFITAAVAALCLLAAGWHVPAEDQARHWNAIAAFAVLGFVSEASYLRLRVGRGETNSSVAFIPYIASLLLFDTGWAISIAATSEFCAEYFVRRKPPLKIVFNVAQQMVSLALASWVYHFQGGGSSLTAFEGIEVSLPGGGVGMVSHFNPVATAAAIVTYFAINSTAVTGAVALSDRLPFDDAWRRIAGPSLVYDVFSSGLGPILALVYVQWQQPGILIVVLPLFFVRHIYQVNLQLEQVNRDLLELMVKAIEARDPYTSGHSLRVSQIAAELARERGLGAKLVEQITTGALLHDVGKIHEDFAPLLRKPSKLDATERALMQTHPSRSAELVSTISAFRGTIEQAVRHHHENFDGSGYPLGLAGEAIPVGARVIMLADTMDAMTTDRPYRKALTYERVIEELRKYSGRQFDPALVAAAERSVAIKAIVKARHRREAADLPSAALAVFARGDRPAWLNRAAAGG
jgi:putative nucleotidyltransferase with HDIG domain